MLEPALTARSFRAIGTTATVVVQDPGDAEVAERLLATELMAIDLACSRFRDDSELQAVHADAGRTVAVSPLLFDALTVACDTAERTGGAVDPTVGNAIAALGYDADLDEVRARPPVPPRALGRGRGLSACAARCRATGPSVFRGMSVSTSARQPRHWPLIGPLPASPTASDRARS